MSFGIFRRPFVIRRFQPTGTVDGQQVFSYEDMVTNLNVYPLSNDDVKSFPEGRTRVKRMGAVGNMVLTPADHSNGRRGDWLYYEGSMDPEGHWYECVGCTGWDHTLLKHCNSEFVQVSPAESKRYPKPDVNPNTGRCQ